MSAYLPPFPEIRVSHDFLSGARVRSHLAVPTQASRMEGKRLGAADDSLDERCSCRVLGVDRCRPADALTTDSSPDTGAPRRRESGRSRSP